MTQSDLACSFCRKSQRDVQLLIAGPDAHICDECVDICVAVLAERELPPRQVTTPPVGYAPLSGPRVVATCVICESAVPVEEALLLREHGRICPTCAGEVVAAVQENENGLA